MHTVTTHTSTEATYHTFRSASKAKSFYDWAIAQPMYTNVRLYRGRAGEELVASR